MTRCIICSRTYVNINAHINKTKKHKINSVNAINKYIRTFNVTILDDSAFNILNADVICYIIDLISYTDANSLCRTSKALMLYCEYNSKKPGVKKVPEKWNLNEAIIYGHLELVDYLLRGDILVPYDVMNLAATFGHVHIFQYFFEKGYKFTYMSISSAMCNNHFDVIIYIYSIKEEHSFVKNFNELYIMNDICRNYMSTINQLKYVKTYIQKHADAKGISYLTSKKILSKNPHLRKFFKDINIKGIFGAMSPLLGDGDWDRLRIEFRKYSV